MTPHERALEIAKGIVAQVRTHPKACFHKPASYNTEQRAWLNATITRHIEPLVVENESLRTALAAAEAIVDAVRAFEIALQQSRAVNESSPMYEKRQFNLMVEWVAVQQLLAARESSPAKPQAEQPAPLQIKPGKWRMRNGEIATVEGRCIEPDTVWHGFIGGDRRQFFHWHNDGNSHWLATHDLIAPADDQPADDAAMRERAERFWHRWKIEAPNSETPVDAMIQFHELELASKEKN